MPAGVVAGDLGGLGAVQEIAQAIERLEGKIDVACEKVERSALFDPAQGADRAVKDLGEVTARPAGTVFRGAVGEALSRTWPWWRRVAAS